MYKGSDVSFDEVKVVVITVVWYGALVTVGNFTFVVLPAVIIML